MTFEQWCQLNGFQSSDLGDRQRGTLQAMFDHTYGPPARPEDPKLYTGRLRPRDRGASFLLGERAGLALNAPAGLELLGETEDLEILAAEGDDGTKLPTFTMLAYNGGILRLREWFYPVVIDLKGMKVSKAPRPVLRSHDVNAIVGHTTSIEKTESQLRAEGIISGTGDVGHEVVETAKNGFPWRASVGAGARKMEFVGEGQTATANGQEFKGPVYIARKSVLGEISFITLAADDGTTVKVAASAGGPQRIEVSDMEFKAWLEAKGFDGDKISAEQRDFFQKAYDAEIAAAAAAGAPKTPDKPAGEGDADQAAGTPAASPTGTPAEVKAGEELRAAAVTAERARVTTIEAACKGFEGERVDELRAQAMAGDVSMDILRAGLLEHVRTERASVSPTTAQQDVQRKALLASGYLAAGIDRPDIVTLCGEPALEAAASLRGLGIQEFCARAAQIDGVDLPRFQSDPAGWLQAAFSTLSLPGILSAAAQVTLLAGYNYVEQVWREIVKIASVTNFLAHTRYRLTGDMKFVKVGPDGELKHAQLGEQEFTQQADTHGIMFGLTRQTIINDDLSAFLAIPRMLGMGAGEAVADAVWTLLLSNPSSFFHANNSNLITGGTSALSIGGLTLAEKAFLDQTKPNGRPLGIPPKKLLVPTALKVTGEELMSSLEMRDTTASKKSPTKNVHAGKFTIACSAYLGNAAMTGSSVTAWYLFADPNVLAALEVAFLNGIDRPTVEKAEADFNVLGVQFRGFLDFGVKEQDPRAAIKSDGV